ARCASPKTFRNTPPPLPRWSSSKFRAEPTHNPNAVCFSAGVGRCAGTRDRTWESPVMSSLQENRAGLAARHRAMTSWSVLVPTPDSFPIGLRQAWREMLEATDDPFALYQSPWWFDYVQEEAGGECAPHVLAVRGEDH